MNHRLKVAVTAVWACACGSDGGDPDAMSAADTVASESTATSSNGAEGMGDTSNAATSNSSAGGAASASTANVTSSAATNGAVVSSSSSGAMEGVTGTGGASGVGGSSSGGSGASDSGTTGGMGTPTHEELRSLPTVRQEHGAAALNGEVYVLGGFTPNASSSVQAYNPESNEWRSVADFPAVFHHPNVAVVGGMLYVAGFHIGSSLREADGRTFAYDPAVDDWLPRQSMPPGTERGAACVASLGTDIYVFGGASDATMPEASVYDTVADEWLPLPPMPELREHCVAAGFDGKIYIVSGRAGGIEGIEVESWVYDPAAQRYDERKEMPTPRAGGAGALLGGRIFVFGGEGNPADPDGIFHEVEAYDPVTNTWEEFPDMTIPRHGYAAAAVADRIYLPGGATSQGFGATDFHTVFFFEATD